MFVIYQLKVGFCLIVFFLLWKLLLSRETFHRFNRTTLLLLVVVAFVLPWVPIPRALAPSLAQPMVVLEELLVTPSGVASTQPDESAWSAVGIATVIYLIGAAIVLLWLLRSQWSLFRLMRKGRRVSLPGGAILHVVPGDELPFSYFNHIVMSEQDYSEKPTEILVHEQAHIALRHSVDVVFIGLAALFQWWNPAVWLLGRELRQVHEFEADQAVLHQGIDAKQYQLLLIRKSVGNQLFTMANNFNYQSLKKRIRMMTINKSNQWKRLRALAIVPAMALALLAFANSNDATTEQSSATESPTTVVAPKSAKKAKAKKTKKSKVYTTVDQMPQFPGGETALMQFIRENVKYPAVAVKNRVQGRVMVQFVIDENGEVGEAEVARSVSNELDAEALRVVKLLPKFIPARVDGKNVAVHYTLPISFKL